MLVVHHIQINFQPAKRFRARAWTCIVIVRRIIDLREDELCPIHTAADVRKVGVEDRLRRRDGAPFANEPSHAISYSELLIELTPVFSGRRMDFWIVRLGTSDAIEIP